MNGTCICGCGRSAGGKRKGYSDACYARWTRQGRPASGPRPPMSTRERNAKVNASRAEHRLDAYDLEEIRRHREAMAALPEAKIERTKPLAAALIRSVHRRDGAAVAMLLEKAARERCHAELAVVLAEWAVPGRIEGSASRAA